MTIHTATVVALLLSAGALVGCDMKKDSTREPGATRQGEATAPRTAEEQERMKNQDEPRTGLGDKQTVEARARGEAVTALDQSDSEVDLERTRSIRQALVKEPDLSFSAKNVVVVSRENRVVIMGTVNSEAERAVVLRVAGQVAGRTSVTDRLKIDANP